MLPILQLGPFSLRTPGLALLAGIWIALEVAQRVGVKRGINGDRTYNLGLITLALGVLGARLSFVLLNQPLYTNITPWSRALLSVFAMAPGTEYPLIGVMIALAAAAAFIHQWHLPPLAVQDTFAPALTIAAAAISLANLLSGEAYGVETSLPWAIPLWGAPRHPTQILMFLASLLTLYILWRTGISNASNHAPGFYAQITLLILCVAILLIEPLRADSPILWDGIRTWEVIALVGILASLVAFTLRAPIRAPTPG